MSRKVPRRLLASVLVASAVVLLGATAAVSNPPTIAGDFVIGAAKATFEDFPGPGESTTESFSVGARSGRSGENPMA